MSSTVMQNSIAIATRLVQADLQILSSKTTDHISPDAINTSSFCGSCWNLSVACLKRKFGELFLRSQNSDGSGNKKQSQSSSPCTMVPSAQWCWWERIWVTTSPRPAPSKRVGMTVMQGMLLRACSLSRHCLPDQLGLTTLHLFSTIQLHWVCSEGRFKQETPSNRLFLVFVLHFFNEFDCSLSKNS